MRDVLRLPVPDAAAARLKRIAGRLPARVNRAIGLRYERRFWRHFLETGGLGFPASLAARLDPHSPLIEPLILDRIGTLPQTISILDVGAGPLTVLGKRVPGRQIEITAVDPLGDAYRALIERQGLLVPVPTRPCAGEDLEQHFGEDRFHVAYARNALDHGRDAPEIVRQMLAVTRPGGFVALRHRRREAEERAYTLLHAWNFDIADGEPILFDRRRSVNLRETFPDARVEAHRDGDWICIVLTKPAW